MKSRFKLISGMTKYLFDISSQNIFPIIFRYSELCFLKQGRPRRYLLRLSVLSVLSETKFWWHLSETKIWRWCRQCMWGVLEADPKSSAPRSTSSIWWRQVLVMFSSSILVVHNSQELPDTSDRTISDLSRKSWLNIDDEDRMGT